MGREPIPTLLDAALQLAQQRGLLDENGTTLTYAGIPYPLEELRKRANTLGNMIRLVGAGCGSPPGTLAVPITMCNHLAVIIAMLAHFPSQQDLIAVDAGCGDGRLGLLIKHLLPGAVLPPTLIGLHTQFLLAPKLGRVVRRLLYCLS
jgi:hypothetical protein